MTFPAVGYFVFSLPLDRRRRLTQHVIDDAIRLPREEEMRQPRQLCARRVPGSNLVGIRFRCAIVAKLSIFEIP